MTDRTYHIMLVEDSATQAISLSAVLEREGWKVIWVASAESAFAALNEKRPDLVLLDYYLPGIRGDEVCRRIRMNVDCRSLPIVMLTSQEGNEVQGLDSGADDFVVKSASPEVLLLRLRTLLQKSRHEDRILAGSESSFSAVRLLAIDDSPTFLEKLRDELSTEGYQLELCTSAEEGLQRLQLGTYDGVIIDLIMPGIDGFEVCRRVNALRRRMELPLISILLTGADTTDNLSQALEAGADDFVGKSNDFSILKGRIRALLRRKFFAEENNRILRELRQKEFEALRERAAKEVAEARAQLVEQLQSKTDELRRSQEELKRALAAKDQFLAVLSHELRTPLTPVLAVVAERIADQRLPADVRQDLAMILRNVQLETHLINDLLDLTRITQGKMEITLQAVDLREIALHVVEMCSSNEAQRAAILLNVGDQPVIVHGDSVRLSQVIWNLLQNALKFTSAEGTVSLSIQRTDDAVRLEVRDTGIGIEADMLDKIFDAFQQESRQVTRNFGGLGLGLAISRAIAERHGGSISAASAGRGQGSVFTLVLPPFVREAPNHPGTEGTAGAGNGMGTAAKRSLRLLLVDDHEDTRETMARLLRRRGHTVLTAGSVQEAARAASEAAFVDVVISDWGLPDGSGADVLREVRRTHAAHGLALSGYGMEDDIRNSLSAGFTEHLTKPVDIRQLETLLAGYTREIATKSAQPAT